MLYSSEGIFCTISRTEEISIDYAELRELFTFYANGEISFLLLDIFLFLHSMTLLFINCNKDEESGEDSDVSSENAGKDEEPYEDSNDGSDEVLDGASNEESDTASDGEFNEEYEDKLLKKAHEEKVRTRIHSMIESEAVKVSLKPIDKDDSNLDELELELVEPSRATMEEIDENEITIFLNHTLPPIPQSWSRCRYYIHKLF